MIRLLRLLFVIPVATGLDRPSTTVSPLPGDQPDDHLVNRPRIQTLMIVGLRNSRSNVNTALDVTDAIVEIELEVMCFTVTCMKVSK